MRAFGWQHSVTSTLRACASRAASSAPHTHRSVDPCSHPMWQMLVSFPFYRQRSEAQRFRSDMSCGHRAPVAGLREVPPPSSGVRDSSQQGSGLCEHLLRGRKPSEGKLAFEKRCQSWTLASKLAPRPRAVASRTAALGGGPPRLDHGAWNREP